MPGTEPALSELEGNVDAINRENPGTGTFAPQANDTSPVPISRMCGRGNPVRGIDLYAVILSAVEGPLHSSASSRSRRGISIQCGQCPMSRVFCEAWGSKCRFALRCHSRSLTKKAREVVVVREMLNLAFLRKYDRDSPAKDSLLLDWSSRTLTCKRAGPGPLRHRYRT